MAELDGSTTLEVLCDEIAQLALWGVQAGLSFYSIVIYTASSLSLAWMTFTMRRWSQMREFTTMPTFFIFTHEYAALGLLGGIACVDANPGETRHAEEQRQPLLEADRLRDDERIATFGYRRFVQ